MTIAPTGPPTGPPSGEILWRPSADRVRRSRLTAFADLVRRRRSIEFDDYEALWQWSVTEPDAFWADVWDYLDIESPTPFDAVLADSTMPGARWFPGAQVNFAAQMLRWTGDDPAIICVREGADRVEISWDELRLLVGSVAATFRAAGVGRGDRVVAYVSNRPETLIAFLACASIGAIWSLCAPDGGVDYALGRFAQLEPRVLIAADGYRFGGAEHDRRGVVAELVAGLPTLQLVVSIPVLYPNAGGMHLRDSGPRVVGWASVVASPSEPRIEWLPAESPLWVVFSSGTTGRPKGIVHSHVGAMLVGAMQFALHFDLDRGDRYFWYTSTSWVMWNAVITTMLVGTTAVLYDGSPTWPSQDRLWQIAAETRATVFGASPAYLGTCAKAGVEPGRQFDLSALTGVGITGAPAPESLYRWIYDQVAPDLALHVICGGTDFVAALLAGAPWLPVTAGEMACRALGMHVESWDASGRPVRDQVGELVVLSPAPSMPIEIWGDERQERYRAAYFDVYPGVWRHGDWMTLSSRGTALVHGRSDSTLNRNGVRMGSADIYAAVEAMSEIEEALVLGVELPDGGYWLPLFVRVAPGHHLDDRLVDRIQKLVRDRVSPRHVPDEVVAVERIPHTVTGKKLEVPLKRLAQGVGVDEALSVSAVDDPGAVQWFVDYFGRRAERAR